MQVEVALMANLSFEVFRNTLFLHSVNLLYFMIFRFLVVRSSLKQLRRMFLAKKKAKLLKEVATQWVFLGLFLTSLLTLSRLTKNTKNMLILSKKPAKNHKKENENKNSRREKK